VGGQEGVTIGDACPGLKQGAKRWARPWYGTADDAALGGVVKSDENNRSGIRARGQDQPAEGSTSPRATGACVDERNWPAECTTNGRLSGSAAQK